MDLKQQEFARNGRTRFGWSFRMKFFEAMPEFKKAFRLMHRNDLGITI